MQRHARQDQRRPLRNTFYAHRRRLDLGILVQHNRRRLAYACAQWQHVHVIRRLPSDRLANILPLPYVCLTYRRAGGDGCLLAPLGTSKAHSRTASFSSISTVYVQIRSRVHVRMERSGSAGVMATVGAEAAVLTAHVRSYV